MSVFQYKAKNQTGKTVTGEIEAKDKSEARMRVLRMRLTIVSLNLKKTDGDLDDGETPILGSFIYKDANGDIQISAGKKAPTSKDLIIFTKQFATMLGSGVPMIQGLSLLSRQQSSKEFAKALKKIQHTVENGAKLSDAMATRPDIFDNLYVAMVEAGEASGNLDVILRKLVTYIEKREKIKNQVKSAMAYPVIVVSVALIVIGFLLYFVVPTFAQQYTDSGRELPALTQLVIDTSNWFVDHFIFIVALIIGGIAYFRVWIQTHKGRVTFDKFILRFPGIGVLLKKVAVGRFCSTMASMLSSGVNLLEALSICAASAGNKTVEAFVLNVRAGLEKGQKFSEPLADGGLFPEMVISMVSVGESTGALDDMLLKVSDFYEEEVELAVQALLSMIEPIMIVVIGGLVGFIVIAMYLPVFDMAGGVQ